MITYTWKITELTCLTDTPHGDYYVIRALCECTGTNGAMSISSFVPCSFEIFNNPNFIEYDDLTEQQVLNWCFDNINKQDIEQSIEQQINGPKEVQSFLPWAVAD